MECLCLNTLLLLLSPQKDQTLTRSNTILQEEKETKYINLISKMQRLYRGYIFEVIVVAVGAMRAVPVPLE